MRIDGVIGERVDVGIGEKIDVCYYVINVMYQ